MYVLVEGAAAVVSLFLLMVGSHSAVALDSDRRLVAVAVVRAGAPVVGRVWLARERLRTPDALFCSDTHRCQAIRHSGTGADSSPIQSTRRDAAWLSIHGLGAFVAAMLTIALPLGALNAIARPAVLAADAPRANPSTIRTP